MRVALIETRSSSPVEVAGVLLNLIISIRALVFAIDNILKGAINVVQNPLRALIGLLDGASLIQFIPLRAASCLRRIIQDSELLRTLLQRAF